VLNTRDKFSNYNKMKNEAENIEKPQGNGVLPCVSKRICDCCGEEHPIMEDNKDGSFTCLSCLIKIDDGNDIDNCMGCDW
jgi:hypothetical protein